MDITITTVGNALRLEALNGHGDCWLAWKGFEAGTPGVFWLDCSTSMTGTLEQEAADVIHIAGDTVKVGFESADARNRRHQAMARRG